MPVFGKGRESGRTVLGKKRESRARQKFINREVSRKRQGKKRLYGHTEYWTDTRCSFAEISIRFPMIFGDLKRDSYFIEERFRKTRKPVVVLDWGCGEGLAISQLAGKYGKKVNAYGFSKDSFENWTKIRNAKLIHATKEDLLQYLKDNSVDLVYSHIGLKYLFPNGYRSFVPVEEGVEYLRKLLKKVSPGGKIVFDAEQSSVIIEKLKQALGKKAKVELIDFKIQITKAG